MHISTAILNSKTPARYYFEKDLIVLNLPVWAKLNANQRYFVLLHELGHKFNQNKNEFAADMFAINEILQDENSSMKETFNDFSNMLNEYEPEHKLRVLNAFKQYILKSNIMKENNENEIFHDLENDENFSELFGLTQASRDRIAQRRAEREAKSEAKIAKQEAKTQAIKDGTYVSNFDKVLGAGQKLGAGIQNTLGGLLGVGAETTTYQVDTPTGAKNNTVIIAVVLIAVVGIGIYFITKK